jgi:hypothetical protein
MEVSGRLHAPVAFTSGKEPPVMRPQISYIKYTGGYQYICTLAVVTNLQILFREGLIRHSGGPLIRGRMSHNSRSSWNPKFHYHVHMSAPPPTEFYPELSEFTWHSNTWSEFVCAHIEKMVYLRKLESNSLGGGKKSDYSTPRGKIWNRDTMRVTTRSIILLQS